MHGVRFNRAWRHQCFDKRITEYELKDGQYYLGSFAAILIHIRFVSQRTHTKINAKPPTRTRLYPHALHICRTTAGSCNHMSGILAPIGVSIRINICRIKSLYVGIPYWTFDIGAFVIGSYEGVFSNGGKDPAYQELYTRMFQLGAFCPIFRSHGLKLPVKFGSSEIFAYPGKIRQSSIPLAPYIYSLAHQVTENGYTIMRVYRWTLLWYKDIFHWRPIHVWPAMMVCLSLIHASSSAWAEYPITAEHFQTNDGKPGLNANIIRHTVQKFDSRKNRFNNKYFWYSGRPDYVTDSTLSIRWEGKLIPTQTGKHQFHINASGQNEFI